MQLSLVALSVLLLTVSWSQVHSAPMFVAAPTSCCFTYIRRQIPQGNVIRYFRTNSMCANPGVIFSTKKGRNICANPSDKWVQNYVNQLDQKAN